MSDKPEIIYALSDPRNPSLPRYIGRTTLTLRRRLGCHISSSKRKPESKLAEWINSLVSLSLVPNIYALEIVVDGAADRETYWIRFFRPLGALTNLSDGPGGLGRPPTNQEKVAPIFKEWNKKRMKPVIGVETGQRFESIGELARALNYDAENLRRSIKCGYRVKGVHWKIIT